MQTFKFYAAQGEIAIRRIGGLPKKIAPPKGYTAAKPEAGRYVIGHSETGHNHVLDRTDGVTVYMADKPPEGMRILRMILENPTVLEHLRPHDTHEPIALDPGEYEVRIAREYDPYAEQARQAAD